MNPLALYLHIPFCKSKCLYCDFYSLSRGEETMDRYCAALSRHLAAWAPQAAGYTVDTVYFGGGTPSYLGHARLASLLETVFRHYRVDPGAEITLEANPDSVGGRGSAAALRAAGFNRVSLGLQSADDGELRAVGRVHTFAQAAQAMEDLRAGGFDNLSLDLIYGLPGQDLAGWGRTLEQTADLGPDHLSCYGLKVEEGTPLWRMRDSLDLPDDDLQADMYLDTVERLARRGYRQYEISNFARPGRESRHNLKYWQLAPYAGFGPGAHSDFGGERYACVRDLPGDRERRGCSGAADPHLPPGAGRGVSHAGSAHRPGRQRPGVYGGGRSPLRPRGGGTGALPGLGSGPAGKWPLASDAQGLPGVQPDHFGGAGGHLTANDRNFPANFHQR